MSDPTGASDAEPVLLEKNRRKKKSKSGKHRAKKRKKKKKFEEDYTSSSVSPHIKVEPGSLEDLRQRDYDTLTPAEQVELDNAPPDISLFEMELMRYPDYKEKLYALLVTRDLTQFVTQRPIDMRLVRASFPGIEVECSFSRLVRKVCCL